MTPSTTPLSESPAAAGGVHSSSPTWKIELLYDGACPLCLREVNFLRKKDAGRGLVSFVDIADEQYAPEAHGNIDFETAMGRIHAVLPDGTVIKNVEVFRRTYSVLGIGWIYAVTNWPIIRPPSQQDLRHLGGLSPRSDGTPEFGDDCRGASSAA